MRLASRMARLGQETAFTVLARAKRLEAQGRSIVHLEIGEPDFDTPAMIVAAAKKALDDGYTHYGPSNGLPQAREAIAAHLSAARGVATDPDEIVITAGAKPIMWYTMIALCEQGDEILYPDPGFPIYASVASFVGATPVALPLREERDFRFSIDDLRARVSDRTRLLILNSPQNPTGGVLTAEDLEAIAALAREHDFWVLTDEVYEKIVYDGFVFRSIYSLPGMKERTILLNGFSKTYAMTGWRLGYGVFPQTLAEQVAKLNTNADSCTASFTQMAGIAALAGPQEPVQAMVEEFRRRRDVIVDGLNRIGGVRCNRPLGAFYVFPNITGTGWSSVDLAEALLDEAGVACLSGEAFGEYGRGFLRFSYATGVENIREALRRIGTFLERHPR